MITPRKKNVAGYVDGMGRFRPIRSPQYVGTPKRKATRKLASKYSRAKAGDLGKARQERALEDVFAREIRTQAEQTAADKREKARIMREIETDTYGDSGTRSKGQTLAQFVRSQGGIRRTYRHGGTKVRGQKSSWDAGEVNRISFKQTGKRGLTTDKGGLTMDKMFQAARESGYNVANMDDLVERVESEAAGGDPTYSTHGFIDYRDNPVGEAEMRRLESVTRKLRSIRKNSATKRNPVGWFKDVSPVTAEAVKKFYKKLATKYHPDKPTGDLRAMQQINADYDKAIRIAAGNEGNAARAAAEREAAGPLREAIEFAVSLPDDVDIVIRGLWLWIEGNTYAAKDKIKSFVSSDGNRFKFASKKKAWFFAAVPSSNKRGEMTFDQIDALHGRDLVKERKRRLALNPKDPNRTAFAKFLTIRGYTNLAKEVRAGADLQKAIKTIYVLQPPAIQAKLRQLSASLTKKNPLDPLSVFTNLAVGVASSLQVHEYMNRPKATRTRKSLGESSPQRGEVATNPSRDAHTRTVRFGDGKVRSVSIIDSDSGKALAKYKSLAAAKRFATQNGIRLEVNPATAKKPTARKTNPRTRRIFQVDLSDDSRLAILATSQKTADNIVARQAKAEKWVSAFDGKPLVVVREKAPAKTKSNPRSAVAKKAVASAMKANPRKIGIHKLYGTHHPICSKCDRRSNWVKLAKVGEGLGFYYFCDTHKPKPKANPERCLKCRTMTPEGIFDSNGGYCDKCDVTRKIKTQKAESSSGLLAMQLTAQRTQMAAAAAAGKYGYGSVKHMAAERAWKTASQRYARAKAKVKSNPKSTAKRRTYEMFQGRPSGAVRTMNVSRHAPARMDQLGDLIELKLADGQVIQPNPKRFKLCAAGGKLWIAGGRFATANPAGGANELNPVEKIVHVVYGTYKPHHGDHKYTHYIHKLGEESGHMPTLAVDREGFPVIRGGKYKIEARGIVN